MAARNISRTAAGGFKIRLKNPKAPGRNGGNEGGQDASDGSRASPLSSMREADCTQYLERVVGEYNERWTDLIRNEPSPWRSPTLSPACAVNPSPRRSPFPHSSQHHTALQPPPPPPKAQSEPQQSTAAAQATSTRHGTGQEHQKKKRQETAPLASPSEEGEMPDEVTLSGSKRQSPRIRNDDDGRNKKVPRRNAAHSTPSSSPPPHGVSPSPSIHKEAFPSKPHSPAQGRSSARPQPPSSPLANGHTIPSRTLPKQNEREHTRPQEHQDSRQPSHSHSPNRPAIPSSHSHSPKRPAIPSSHSHSPKRPAFPSSQDTPHVDSDDKSNQRNVRIRFGGRSKQRADNNISNDNNNQRDNNHNTNSNQISTEMNGYTGGSHRSGWEQKDKAQHSQDQRDAWEEENDFMPNSKRRRQSLDSHEQGSHPPPPPPKTHTSFPPSPPQYTDILLSPMSPHMIEPDDVIPETTEVGVQAAAEYTDAGVQAEFDPLGPWALRTYTSEGREARKFLSVSKSKLRAGLSDHPLQGKVLEYNTSQSRTTKERLLSSLREHGQKNYQKARELKHAVDKEVKANSNKWTIETLCRFTEAAVGFLECQELMAVTRKDAASGNEFLSVATLFGVAANQANKVERAESSGLARLALHVLCQRMQAVALMRFVYHSTKALKQDYEAAKASAGLDVGNGLSPDDSTTSSQEVHSTGTPTRVAGRGRNAPEPVVNAASRPNAPPLSQNSLKRMTDTANSMIKSVEILAKTASACQDLASQANHQLNEDIKMLPVLLGAVGTDAGMTPHGLRVVQSARHVLDLITTLIKPKTS